MVTALYRRYRPETFAEMIGQSQVTEPLMTALRTDRVNHAILRWTLAETVDDHRYGQRDMLFTTYYGWHQGFAGIARSLPFRAAGPLLALPFPDTAPLLA